MDKLKSQAHILQANLNSRRFIMKGNADSSDVIFNHLSPADLTVHNSRAAMFGVKSHSYSFGIDTDQNYKSSNLAS